MFYQNSIRKFVIAPLLGLGITLALSAHVSALASKDLSSLKKDIRVISKLLESSTELTGSRAHPRVDGTYLADQGILLSISFRGLSNRYFSEYAYSDDIPGPDPEEISEIVNEAMEQARENWPSNIAPLPPVPPVPEIASFSDSSHQSKEMKAYRDEKKAYYNEQRKMMKQIRDMEKSARNDKSKNLNKKLEEKRKALEASRKQLKEKKKLLKEKLKKIKAKQQAQKIQQYAIWKLNVLNAYCQYAPVPKALSSKEHVTLKFNDATYADGKRADSFVVLNRSQLQDCRSGKIDGKTLLKKARQYNF